MPLWAGYEDELASKIADLNNIASSPFAGAIFGALFLKRFVSESTRWLHMWICTHGTRRTVRAGVWVPRLTRCARTFRYLVKRYGTA